MIDPNRLTFTDEKLDATIMEIKPFDEILHFLDIDDNIFSEKDPNELNKNETVNILHYPGDINYFIQWENLKELQKPLMLIMIVKLNMVHLVLLF